MAALRQALRSLQNSGATDQLDDYTYGDYDDDDDQYGAGFYDDEDQVRAGDDGAVKRK